MKTASILALYLPQFHKVPENDKWWGEGFSDWVAVKGAKALFEGHKQPNKPLNNRYYNLLDHDVMQWQSKLMHQYNIDGMCMYHYWFGNGNKLLEKPAENLLKWTDIDMPYCFCWANESWGRTWSKFTDINVWADVYDSDEKNGERGLLVEQVYGEKEEWIKHFNYLLPFFKDSRYLKRDGRAVFVIYKPHNINCLDAMAECWNDLCEKAGLKKIYFIGMEDFRCDCLDEICIRQPNNAMYGFLRDADAVTKNGVRIFDYDEIYKSILADTLHSKKSCLCAFTGYDTTPRKGNKGEAVIGGSPEKFQEYLMELLKVSSVNQSEYVFINAWNEWGESMYLEPDVRNGYAYLEAVQASVKAVKAYVMDKEEREHIKRRQADYYNLWIRSRLIYEKFLKLNQIWSENNTMGKTIEKYLLKNKIQNIAIYGLGKMADRLIGELKGSRINILYGIDKSQVKDKQFPFPVFNKNAILPFVDEIIITPIMLSQNEYIEIASGISIDVKTEILENVLFNTKNIEITKD